MCAGFSSRFEGVDKFMIPLKLDTDRTLNLLDLTFMRIRANTDCLDLPVIVSCNEFNIEKIQIYIKQRDYYGFDPSKFRFIEAYSLAVFDSKGKYCVTGKFRLIRRPSGTAVTVEELLRGSIYQFLKDTGVEYVQINGMENLMQNPCDPVMIGLIINEHKKLVAKCTHSCFHYEPLNRYFKDRKSGSIELLSTNGNMKIPTRSIITMRQLIPCRSR